MKRREFFRNSAIATLGATIATSVPGSAEILGKNPKKRNSKSPKNIIFLVSDGMSTGTLNMANLLMERKEGRTSAWMKLYRENKAKRALMDTASANSLVTDSAAASSSWGCGVRVPNGSINVGANNESYKPILQKFKDAGKAVGCVTTVPITHATPAGFCVNSKSRGEQDEIAEQYLSLKFDVMMGGGSDYFSNRKDGKDLISKFKSSGYNVALTRKEMLNLKEGAPVLGVFSEDGLPYALDREQEASLLHETPTLAEMTETAINLMKGHPNGFVMQVEAGKVDWAAHANDICGLLYDQIAFDNAIEVAIKFAEQNNDTLVIITTDHGNANPGLIGGNKTNEDFDRIQHFKYTNTWVLNGITPQFTAAQVIDRIHAAQGLTLTHAEANSLLEYYSDLDETGLYNPRQLPFKRLAEIQSNYISVGWAGMNHSADYVELAMFGPGSENLPPFVLNTDLHNFMLNACEVRVN